MACVTEFVERVSRLGFRWSQRDCLTWLGLWSEENTGIDGAAEWRGRYRTRIGCLRALSRSGGMEACIERGALAAGMVRTGDPVVGAVGLINLRTAKGVEPVGAIFNGVRWSALTERGVLSVRAEPVVAWNLP